MSVAVGVPNPWMLISQLGVLLLVIFIVDAAVTAWRRGDRAVAVSVGGSIAICMFVGLSQAILQLWGIVESPVTISVFYVLIVGVMACAMGVELQRAKQVVADLREREAQAALAAAAANMGIWVRETTSGTIWASDKWRELFGFMPHEPLSLETLLQRIHPRRSRCIQQHADTGRRASPRIPR